MSQILDGINGPSDLKGLTPEQLVLLAAELRHELVATVSNTGGHLASNLGVFELTVALHRVFDSPKDKLIWDVGHQSYVHKLLTGRRQQFGTLRQQGGISGFTNRAESQHDPFGAGHASTSVSAALGSNCRAMGSCAGSARSISASISDVIAIAIDRAAAARRGSGVSSPSRSRAFSVRSVGMAALR